VFLLERGILGLFLEKVGEGFAEMSKRLGTGAGGDFSYKWKLSVDAADKFFLNGHPSRFPSGGIAVLPVPKSPVMGESCTTGRSLKLAGLVDGRSEGDDVRKMRHGAGAGRERWMYIRVLYMSLNEPYSISFTVNRIFRGILSGQMVAWRA